MVIEPYTPSKRAEWDRFVSSHPMAGYGHLSVNFNLARELEGASNRSLMLYDASGRLIAVMPLFLVEARELRFVKVRALVSAIPFPAGPLLAEDLKGKSSQAALDEIVAYSRNLASRLHVDQIRVNYPTVVQGQLGISRFGYLPLRQYGFRESNLVGLLLDVRQDREALWNRVKKGCRSSIRKAEADGIDVRHIGERGEWLACHPLNVETLGNLAYSHRAMEIIWDEFIEAGFATAYATVFEGVVVSVVVLVHWNSSSYYWMAFSRKAKPVAGVNNLLLWKAILDMKERGYHFVELGSKEFSNRRLIGISEFKEAFGGAPHYGLGGVLELKPFKKLGMELIRLGATRFRRLMRRVPSRAA